MGGKGYVWVNGHNLGRYWSIQAEGTCDACDYRGKFVAKNHCKVGCNTSRSQRFYHVPIDWVTKTDNFLVLMEEIGGNPQAISLVDHKMGVECGSVGEDYPKDD